MSAAQPEVAITVSLTQGEAWQFAQFLKRVSHSDYRANACDNQEAYIMLHAGEKIRDALRDAGFNPR